MERIEWLYTGSGICIYDATDLRGIERKWVNDRRGCVIRFRFTKRRGKGTKRARIKIGSCVSFRAAGSRVRILVSPVTFFFCIAGAYPVWHARDPQPVQFFRAVELPSMKKRLGERRLVRSGNLATHLP